MPKRIIIYVTGRVQGVFFRASTQHKAKELLLRGYVQNEPDGRVKIEAEGEDTAINHLVEWCKKGPELATVEHIQTKESEDVKGFEGFEIRR